MALNAEWHRAHVLGSGAAMDRRIAWHREHVAVCGCRPVPASVQHAMDAQGASGNSCDASAPGLWLTLRFRDPPRMTAWLEAIGFTLMAEYLGDDGTLVHAEYLGPCGGGVMAGPERTAVAWPQAPGTQAAYLVVHDVDVTHAAALRAGGSSLYEPHDEDYGGRGSTVRDPEGNLWSFGTYRPSAG